MELLKATCSGRDNQLVGVPPSTKRTHAPTARCSNLEVNKARGVKVQRRRTFYHDMKRIFFALTLLALWLPAWQPVKATDVSVDFFYNNLSGGNWIEVADYGYGWQPDVAVNDPNWRPYADGYWAYTDDGWTWISYEDFGWATYHYGRWARLADTGWLWFPGSDLDWGPAWVSWRTGGDYVGWAPLPPRGPGIVYEGQPIGARVDIEFDIGPEYYNFIDARFIGEPVLRDRIFAPSQNVTYINNTVNVTNISVQNNVVYNYGPDYNVLSARSSRPIQRLNIERQANVDPSAAAKSGALTKVQGNKLIVGAPTKINKAAQGIAPPRIKTKVAQPKIEKGWTGVANAAQLKQKIQTENPKNIPPPTAAAATGQVPGGISPTAPTAPFETGRGKGRPAGTPPTAGTSPTATDASAASPAPFEKHKGKGRPGERPQPGMTGAPITSPAEAASPNIQGGPPAGKERGRPGRGRLETSPPPPAGQTGAAPVAPEATQPPGKHKGQFERGVAKPTPEQPGGAANQPPQGQYRGLGSQQTAAPAAGGAPYEGRAGKQKGQGAFAQPSAPPTSGAAPGETGGGKQRGQGAYAQPGGAPGGGPPAGGGQEKPKGGKKKGEQGSPTPPGPQ
jgi:Family of unknown function (DUF6600)